MRIHLGDLEGYGSAQGLDTDPDPAQDLERDPVPAQDLFRDPVPPQSLHKNSALAWFLTGIRFWFRTLIGIRLRAINRDPDPA